MDINDNPIQNTEQQKKKKKCHGNRRDQRFRRKCRARGMEINQIEELLNKNKEIEKAKQNATTTTTTTSNEGLIEVENNNQSKKRKRKVPSCTSKSIKRPSLTKRKMTSRHPITTADNQLINKNYRRPMYLKWASYTLFQMLHKRLKYPLKQKNEQQFIYKRLELLDQHYCLQVDLELWQSYLELGEEKHQWPVQLSKMANTQDYNVCHQYLLNYIEDMKKQMNQLQMKLTEQAELYPITSISLEQMNQYLTEFVKCQRKYLSTRNNNQLNKFTDHIMENELFENITSNNLSINNNELINQLIIIRQKQTECWEELLQLKMHILYKFLLSYFDQLQEFLTSINYLPISNQQTEIQLNNQHYTIIQEIKRQWLHILLSIYEKQLQDYDHQYKELFNHLESILRNDSNIHFASVSNSIRRYMTYRMNQFKQQIRNKMVRYREKLIQYRRRSVSAKLMIGVSPRPYLSLNFNPFTILEWNYLSLGPSYIRLNQSVLCSPKQQEKDINTQYEDIYDKTKRNLMKKERIPLTAPILKQYSNQLHDDLEESYFTPIPYKDYVEANKQAKLAKSIQKKMKQFKLVIRVTDKSKNFYIGSAIEFEKKAQKYFNDTNAFERLTKNPFKDILYQVTQTLNYLRRENCFSQKQYEEMMPDRTKNELAYLYFNPKTHKVCHLFDVIFEHVY